MRRSPPRSGLSSPRAWGCFSVDLAAYWHHFVFPTGVGMFLPFCTKNASELCLPHGRGDVSPSQLLMRLWLRSSPRAWGCFLRYHDPASVRSVFPTGVGMFPYRCPRCNKRLCLPHGRGDVSLHSADLEPRAESSPRAWGCFHLPENGSLVVRVFPTGVGMFLPFCTKNASELCLPHGRGDVSPSQLLMRLWLRSSPRAWGCFLRYHDPASVRSVFPTGVGMFPYRCPRCNKRLCLPHGRGDVSLHSADLEPRAESSPRAWGCFHLPENGSLVVRVFPTGVGMFPYNGTECQYTPSLPHGRGDVSVGRVHPGLVPQSSPRTWGCFHGR